MTTITVSLDTQFKKNIRNGKRAEIFAIYDLASNGFSIFYTGGRGHDFFAYKSNQNFFFVEVKLNKSQLTKKQKKFRALCKKFSIGYFIYRVYSVQLNEWGF